MLKSFICIKYDFPLANPDHFLSGMCKGCSFPCFGSDSTLSMFIADSMIEWFGVVSEKHGIFQLRHVEFEPAT